MDKDILKAALDEMRGEMRSRVGKKLLSIEVHQHTDEEPAGDEVDGEAQPGAGKEAKSAKNIGIPII